MNLSAKQLDNIAQSLDVGFICYVHKKTGELKEMISEEIAKETDVWEEWKEDMQEIEKEPDKYVQLETMSSEESFSIMEDFAAQVGHQGIKARLFGALNGRKPFRNFKNQVDYNENLRQAWFAFKQKRYEEWVMRQLEGEL